MKKQIILPIIFIFITNILNATEIEKRGMSSEPKVKPPTYMGKEPNTPDEPIDRYEQYDLDIFEISEPTEPKEDNIFMFMDKAYDKELTQPVEPTLSEATPNVACPVGAICTDPTDNILNEPPYQPETPYIKNIP